MNLYCPYCGKEVPNEDTIFCPYCSKPLKLIKKHSGFPTVAGILTIIAACIVIIFGTLEYSAIANDYTIYMHYHTSYDAYDVYGALITGIWCTICFGLGLAAGVLSIKRRRFVLSIIGTSLLLVTALFMLTESIGLAVLAIPVLILSVLSVVFVGISKGEFTYIK
jgi:hypothetical protein